MQRHHAHRGSLAKSKLAIASAKTIENSTFCRCAAKENQNAVMLLLLHLCLAFCALSAAEHPASHHLSLCFPEQQPGGQAQQRYGEAMSSRIPCLSISETLRCEWKPASQLTLWPAVSTTITATRQPETEKDVTAAFHQRPFESKGAFLRCSGNSTNEGEQCSMFRVDKPISAAFAAQQRSKSRFSQTYEAKVTTATGQRSYGQIFSPPPAIGITSLQFTPQAAASTSSRVIPEWDLCSQPQFPRASKTSNSTNSFLPWSKQKQQLETISIGTSGMTARMIPLQSPKAYVTTATGRRSYAQILSSNDTQSSQSSACTALDQHHFSKLAKPNINISILRSNGSTRVGVTLIHRLNKANPATLMSFNSKCRQFSDILTSAAAEFLVLSVLLSITTTMFVLNMGVLSMLIAPHLPHPIHICLPCVLHRPSLYVNQFSPLVYLAASSNSQVSKKSTLKHITATKKKKTHCYTSHYIPNKRVRRWQTQHSQSYNKIPGYSHINMYNVLAKLSSPCSRSNKDRRQQHRLPAETTYPHKTNTEHMLSQLTAEYCAIQGSPVRVSLLITTDQQGHEKAKLHLEVKSIQVHTPCDFLLNTEARLAAVNHSLYKLFPADSHVRENSLSDTTAAHDVHPRTLHLYQVQPLCNTRGDWAWISGAHFLRIHHSSPILVDNSTPPPNTECPRSTSCQTQYTGLAQHDTPIRKDIFNSEPPPPK